MDIQKGPIEIEQEPMDSEQEPAEGQRFLEGEGNGEESYEEGSLVDLLRGATAALSAPKPDTTPGGLPRQPRNWAELGLSKAFLMDLALKIIHYAGNPSATQLVRRLGLAQNIVQQIIAALTEERLCEVTSQSDLYAGSYRYRLSGRGQERLMQALERTRYAGPAPVTAAQYTEVVLRQQQGQANVTRGRVKEAVASLVLAPEVAEDIARALFSGKPAILYGPSGNGKSHILDRFAAAVDGDVLVPYAIYAHGQVVRVFDPTIHHIVEDAAKDDDKMDRRWLRIRRPAIILSAELDQKSLDLAYDPLSRFYQAPPHLKAQGGVLIVDDLGRQRMGARDLLARLLIPLERGWDTLSLASGEQLRLPFHLQLLFATNLPLGELADEGLLRRILYKVKVPSPTPGEFAEILKHLCHRKQVLVPKGSLDYVIQQLYGQPGLEPRAALARDLLDILVESARFDAREPVLTPNAFDHAFRLLTARQRSGRSQGERAGDVAG